MKAIAPSHLRLKMPRNGLRSGVVMNQERQAPETTFHHRKPQLATKPFSRRDCFLAMILVSRRGLRLKKLQLQLEQHPRPAEPRRRIRNPFERRCLLPGCLLLRALRTTPIMPWPAIRPCFRIMISSHLQPRTQTTPLRSTTDKNTLC
jgi:hypothetical protein